MTEILEGGESPPSPATLSIYSQRMKTLEKKFNAGEISGIENHTRSHTTWLRIRKFLRSSLLQKIMLLLILIYIILVVIETVVTLLFESNPRRYPYDFDIEIVNIATSGLMLLFPLEIILQAIFSEVGFLRYFCETWTIFDFLIISSLAIFDILEIFFDEIYVHITLLMLTFRICRALRSLYLYSRAKIRRSQAVLSELHDLYKQLNNDLDDAARRNEAIRKEHDLILESIEKNKKEIGDYAQSTIDVQGKVWSSIVPMVSIRIPSEAPPSKSKAASIRSAIEPRSCSPSFFNSSMTRKPSLNNPSKISSR